MDACLYSKVLILINTPILDFNLGRQTQTIKEAGQQFNMTTSVLNHAKEAMNVTLTKTLCSNLLGFFSQLLK